MSEQVAIMRHVKIGASDRGWPGLSFQTYITESSAASQFLNWDDAKAVVSTVSDVKELEGKPCWVDVDGNLIRFLRLWDKP